MNKWYPSAVIGYTVVITLCVVFSAWIGAALIRWANEPYYPPVPSPLQAASIACSERGGIPKTKWVERKDYSPVEMFDTCEEQK